MFNVVLTLFFAIFAVAVIVIIVGAWATFRLSGKIFRAVEQELDRKIAEPGDGSVPGKQKCAHCGVLVAVAEKCPNCGAALV